MFYTGAIHFAPFVGIVQNRSSSFKGNIKIKSICRPIFQAITY